MTGRRPHVAMIYAITATSITANALLGAALPEVTRGLGAPPGAAGLLIGAATLPGIVLAPVMGLLADRFGRREVLVPCLVLFGVAGGLGAIAPTWSVLVGLRLVQGIGSAGLTNLAVVVIGDHWEGQERARVMGRNAAVLTTSLFVLPMIAGAVTDLVGWRALFLGYLASLAIAVAVQRSLPAGRRRDVRIADQLRDVVPVLRLPEVTGTVVASVLVFALVFGLLLTVLPVYLGDTFGLSASERGILLALPAVPNTAAALSLGWLHARVRQRTQLVAASLLLVVATLVAGTAPTLPLLIVGVLLFGAGEGLVIPTLQTMAASAGPPESRGAVVATFVGGARLGQTLGPLAAGAVLAIAGAQQAFLLGAPVAVALAVVVAVSAPANPYPRSLRTRR